MAKYYYNGVLLPEIPADVLAEYPYSWIRNNTTSGHYDLFFSKISFYLVDTDSISGADVEKPWYRVEITSANTADNWVFNKTSTANLGLDTARTVLWSNHDIPNGSATSTTIYFYGSDPVPENEAKPKELQYEIYHDFYPSSGNINYLPDTKYVNYVVPVVKYSTYTVTMIEVGTRLRSVFTTVDPATITANITGCTDIVMNPTFAAGYTFTYFAQEDGWMVVYVSNAGERPKISIVTNGAGGDGAPLYDRKYLVRSGSTLYTITDGTLTALAETEITASLFQTYGVDDLPAGSLLVGLTDPEVLYWQDSEDELPELTLTVTGSPPVPQIVVTNTQDMSDPSILGIESATVDASDDVLFAISFDDGVTWKAYDGGKWVTLSAENSGMTKTTMENISLEAWAQVAMSAMYKLRFVLMDTDSYVSAVRVNYIN